MFFYIFAQYTNWQFQNILLFLHLNKKSSRKQRDQTGEKEYNVINNNDFTVW